MSFLIALAVAVVLTPILSVIGLRVRLVDRPGELKIHDRPTPVTGGLAVLGAAVAGIALTGHPVGWVGLAACVGLGGGLIDDLRSLPPWVRIVVQGAAGALLVAGGLRLEPFGALGGSALVVATIACCNAVNMVDGQDGLAAGLGAIAAFGIAGVLATSGLPAALPLSVAGALVGFLFWNRPPARVFLGDGGAYAVGILLAASAARTTAEGWHGVLASGACLGVFAYELVASVARRRGSVSSVVRGDRDHSYDRLGVRLRSRSAATLVMWTLGIVAGTLGLAIAKVHPIVAVGVVVIATLATALLDVRLLPAASLEEDR